MGMRVLLVIITIILLGGSVFGADYYIDAINGNDNNSGTSQSQAWRSILKVCYATFVPGDNIYFKRGCIWRNQLSIPNMGAQGAPITFGAYGSGDKPIICAADLATGWEIHSTNIWKLSNRSPKQIFFNGVRGTKQNSLSHINSEYDWFWENEILYVYSTSDPDSKYTDPGIEVSWKFYGIINRHSYINVENFTVCMAEGDGIIVTDGADHVSITSIEAIKNYWVGIKISDGESVSSNCTISNNVCKYNGGSGIAISHVSNSTISHNFVDQNTQLQTTEEQHNWTAGIKANSTDSESNIFEYNTCSNAVAGAGIWLDFCGPDNIVRYNRCFGNYSNGIYNEITSGTLIYYNILYNNIGSPSASGIWISGREGVAPLNGNANNNLVYNNFCYGNGVFGILLQNDDGIAGNTNNNIIKNNIAVNTINGPNLRVGGAAESAANIIEYNCFGPESDNFIEWGWGVFKDNYSSWESAYGSNTHSIQAEPVFNNPSNGDFFLHHSSPCIDHGMEPTINSDYDIAGTKLPQGFGFEIGAYEYYGDYANNLPSFIIVEPSALSFSAEAGGSDPLDQLITIAYTSEGIDSWIATEQPDQSWMILTNSNNGSEGKITVSLNITGLGEGSYNGTVRVEYPNTTIGYVDVPITLTISAGTYAAVINEWSQTIPKNFRLEQNYPNPFNPTTRIKYDLPEASFVKINIYNIQGKKIVTLVDELKNAGRHSIKWNGQNDFGSQVATGVYFYRIEAGNFNKVRKMIMVK